MSLSYPLALPTTSLARSLRLRARSVVGVSESPFTGSLQTYAHQGEILEAEVALPPMARADAESWIAFLLALNGREGTFLMGFPHDGTVRGTWAGASPVVHGASQTGRSLAVDGLTPFATALAGDWIQLGSGSSSRLHKVLQNVTFDSGGEGTLDLWPRIVTAPSDDAAVTLASAKGCWRLGSNDREWTVEEAAIYGLSFSARQEI